LFNYLTRKNIGVDDASTCQSWQGVTWSNCTWSNHLIEIF
jgi:hypothetical protein